MIEEYLKEHARKKAVVGELLDKAPFTKKELTEWCIANPDKWESVPPRENNLAAYLKARINSGLNIGDDRIVMIRYGKTEEKHNLDADTGFFGYRPSCGPLMERFTFPPMSVWDTKNHEWIRRRRLWIRKGIKSEEGRSKKLTYNLPMMLKDGRTGRRIMSQTSVFDPMICELAYGWWCRPGGVIVDPFAGGSVRGIVASLLGHRYLGIDLSGEQIRANEAQINDNTRGRFAPKWIEGNSLTELAKLNKPYDFLFSCPPYGNLEVYSSAKDDISNMTYDEFLVIYREIVRLGVAGLRDNRFACFVVANFRSKEKGRQMIDFVGDTIRAFEDAGAMFYNDVVLINSYGTGPMRANTNFVRGSRKVVKQHQNVLVFCKGDPALAAADIPASAGISTGDAEEAPG